MKTVKHVRSLIAIVCVAFSSLVASAQSDTLNIRFMTYNLRFGELSTLSQLGEHIKSFAPDFVALEEVDVNTYRTINKHQNGKNFINELAYTTNMFGVFGRAIEVSGGYYGVGLLSKYPIIKTETTPLPNPDNTEQRVLLRAWVDRGNGDTLVVAATHLCYLRENGRLAQAGAIVKMLTNIGYPTILGGDFNTLPTSDVLKKFYNAGWSENTDRAPTYPANAPDEKLDYVFTYPAQKWQSIKSTAIPSLLSDHLPVVVDLRYVK